MAPIPVSPLLAAAVMAAVHLVQAGCGRHHTTNPLTLDSRGCLCSLFRSSAPRTKRRRPAQAAEHTTTSPGVFWLHISSFGVYNSLIGYLLLHRIRPGLLSLAFYTTAMALHFLVTDYGLRKDHRGDYDRIGRWALSAALIGGLAAGYLTRLPELWIAVITAFLAGGVILNVLNGELPEERKSRIAPFFLGAFGYAALLLLA